MATKQLLETNLEKIENSVFKKDPSIFVPRGDTSLESIKKFGYFLTIIFDPNYENNRSRKKTNTGKYHIRETCYNINSYLLGSVIEKYKNEKFNFSLKHIKNLFHSCKTIDNTNKEEAAKKIDEYIDQILGKENITAELVNYLKLYAYYLYKFDVFYSSYSGDDQDCPADVIGNGGYIEIDLDSIKFKYSDLNSKLLSSKNIKDTLLDTSFIPNYTDSDSMDDYYRRYFSSVTLFEICGNPIVDSLEYKVVVPISNNSIMTAINHSGAFIDENGFLNINDLRVYSLIDMAEGNSVNKRFINNGPDANIVVSGNSVVELSDELQKTLLNNISEKKTKKWIPGHLYYVENRLAIYLTTLSDASSNYSARIATRSINMLNGVPNFCKLFPVPLNEVPHGIRRYYSNEAAWHLENGTEINSNLRLVLFFDTLVDKDGIPIHIDNMDCDYVNTDNNMLNYLKNKIDLKKTVQDIIDYNNGKVSSVDICSGGNSIPLNLYTIKNEMGYDLGKVNLFDVNEEEIIDIITDNAINVINETYQYIIDNDLVNNPTAEKFLKLLKDSVDNTSNILTKEFTRIVSDYNSYGEEGTMSMSLLGYKWNTIPSKFAVQGIYSLLNYDKVTEDLINKCIICSNVFCVARTYVSCINEIETCTDVFTLSEDKIKEMKANDTTSNLEARLITYSLNERCKFPGGNIGLYLLDTRTKLWGSADSANASQQDYESQFKIFCNKINQLYDLLKTDKIYYTYEDGKMINYVSKYESLFFHKKFCRLKMSEFSKIPNLATDNNFSVYDYKADFFKKNLSDIMLKARENTIKGIGLIKGI